MPTVTLNSGEQFLADAATSLLDAASNAHISLPYSCKTGRCSSCKCKVISGTTTLLQPESGLSEREVEEGWILSCVRAAETDLILEAENLGNACLPVAKTLPCRINALEQLASDVIKVQLRLPPTAEFNFIPGQYIDIIGPGGIRRSYSLANANFVDKLLELHIRAVEGGAMSEYWFKQAKNNDLLRLNGPLGTFFLRQTANTDLIFLATGTGIAPVKAILESIAYLPVEERPSSIVVLWGGRTQEDLYFDVAALPGKHRFYPVLSRASDEWKGLKGHIQDALLTITRQFGNAAVYACGSDAMIHSAKEALVNAGLPSHRFYSDAFVCSATHTSN